MCECCVYSVNTGMGELRVEMKCISLTVCLDLCPLSTGLLFTFFFSLHFAPLRGLL